MKASTKPYRKICARTPLLVIVGPTASGKSDLAVQMALATKDETGAIRAEIISADSRQVYTGLDIGTGKITREEMHGVPHHLLDVADPAATDARGRHIRFTAMDWKKLAEKAIIEIRARGNLPIVVGGTGFYISALIDDLGFPDVAADTDEQQLLETESAEILFEKLKKLDPARAATIDQKNKRRLSRAIVIARALGSVPPIAHGNKTTDASDTDSEGEKYDLTMIGIKLPDAELKSRIRARLIQHLEHGMIEEVERLHAPRLDPATGVQTPGLSWERMDELGLEYRYIARYLQQKNPRKDTVPDDTMTLADLTDILATKIWQYARRQKAWFKKDPRIQWINPKK